MPRTAGDAMPTSVQFPVMGTQASVVVYGDGTSSEAAVAAVRETLLRIEKVANLYDPFSELARLNAGAASAPFVCSEELWAILSAARKTYQLSGGAFDISAKPLMDLWGFYRKRGDFPPSETEIAETLTKVGLDKVIFDDARRSVRFTVPGMAFDLGGIAKGFAVDRAAAAVMALGIRRGIIDLGGNIRVLPEPPPGKAVYHIAIRNPGKKDEFFEKKLEMLDNAVATSGNYERFVVLAGRKYAHIINPVSGKPVDGDTGVTVVTRLALDADALSTTCFLLGSAWCRENRAKLPPDTTIYFYTASGIETVVGSSGE
jgi:thiamine biosynthesis lipoprotein